LIYVVYLIVCRGDVVDRLPESIIPRKRKTVLANFFALSETAWWMQGTLSSPWFCKHSNAWTTTGYRRLKCIHCVRSTCPSLILNIIYVWKLNQTVLELDFRAVNFLFFSRRDLNPHHWYTLSIYVPSTHA
jgi:hypothetical protein